MAEPEWLEALRRNSGLSLTRDGVWMYGALPVESPRVQAMFHQGVAVRDDGEVTLSVGRMWAYVKTDGPAFFVRAVIGLDGRPAAMRLLGDREAPLASASIAGWGPDDRLYLWLSGLAPREVPAVCLREAHQVLAAHVEERERGHVLALGDLTLPLVMLAEIPAAAAARPASGDSP